MSRVDVFWQLMKNLSTDPRVTEFISSFESQSNPVLLRPGIIFLNIDSIFFYVYTLDFQMPVRERNTENNYGMNASRVRNPSARPCRFFIQGRCRYGNQCRFSHNIASRNNRSDDTSSLNVLIDGEPQTFPPQRQDSTTGTSRIGLISTVFFHFS